MPKEINKRPTIGFFVSELEGDYTEALCGGMIDAAEDYDVNLIILPGKTIKLSYAGQYNFNVIYEYVNPKNVDAIIMASSVLSGFIKKSQFDAFCSRYKPLPIVSIGIPVDGISCVLTKNQTGFMQILNHLINDHGKQRIAFIKGPDEHVEAVERFLVYRQALKENGLVYDPALVVPGNFTVYSVEDALKTLIDERKAKFDAIVASNDEMALGVLDFLQKRGILVPEQVSVTGFDDGEGAKYSNPSLTTVKQPIYELAQQALSLALQLIQGKKVENVFLETKMIIRESCGCLSESLQSFNSTQLNSKREPTDAANLKIDQLINRFITGNYERIGIAIEDFDFLKTFLINCFQVFARNQIGPGEVENLLKTFIKVTDSSGLKENDILTIQKTITALKESIESLVKAEDRFVVEDFFQRLRVLIADTLLKMQGERLNLHHLEIRHLRKLLVEMVSKSHDYHEQLQSIIPRLRSMGITTCFVYLYDKPIVYHQNDLWQNPAMVNLVMAFNEEDQILLEKDHRLPWEKVLNNRFLPDKKRYTLLFNPLFVEDEHMGLILLEINLTDNYLFESFIVEMSCALKLSLLFYEREQINNRLYEVVKELEASNEKLSTISQTDDLTGLYNRRGFLNLARQSLNLARKQGKKGLMFFADMDALKQINDIHGHDEGDVAIKAMGNILVKTFRASDIIARLGGDEFTIFTVDSDLDLLAKIKRRLYRYTKEYNLQSGKPYQISITIGAVPFENDEDATVENLIRQADNILYEEKKRKREK
jgi:diguanylate cyclase (GGDEF)-like protein